MKASEVKPGALVRHYKHRDETGLAGLYMIVRGPKDCEDLRPRVVYRAVADGVEWDRTLAEFTGDVGVYGPNPYEGPRFIAVEGGPLWLGAALEAVLASAQAQAADVARNPPV